MGITSFDLTARRPFLVCPFTTYWIIGFAILILTARPLWNFYAPCQHHSVFWRSWIQILQFTPIWCFETWLPMKFPSCLFSAPRTTTLFHKVWLWSSHSCSDSVIQPHLTPQSSDLPSLRPFVCMIPLFSNLNFALWSCTRPQWPTYGDTIVDWICKILVQSMEWNIVFQKVLPWKCWIMNYQVRITNLKQKYGTSFSVNTGCRETSQ